MRDLGSSFREYGPRPYSAYSSNVGKHAAIWVYGVRTVECMYAFLRRTEKNIRNIIFLCFAQEGIHALHCTPYVTSWFWPIRNLDGAIRGGHENANSGGHFHEAL